jgi:methionine-gamma-lyase
MTWKLSTRSVHVTRTKWQPHAGEGAHVPPIYQTTNFDYPDARSADEAAQGRAYLYTRDANPTSDAFAHAVAQLEGAESGLAFAAGMGAMYAAVMAHVDRGDHVVASEGLYGGTTGLVRNLLPRLGVDATLVAAWDTDAVEQALRPKTRVLVVETITNPLVRVSDLPALGQLCRERGITLIVDSTFATPIVCRPLEHGASIVMHSATKYIGGHGDVSAGLCLGARAAVEKLLPLRSMTGGVLDPFAAWLGLRGLRTLALRVERQCENALRIARGLEGHPKITKVYYPGLKSHPDHERARKLLASFGAMLSFEVAGGGAGARRVYDGAKLIARAASLGEVESLFTHPASFSHRALSADERARLGISDGLLRLSVGIEDADDILADILHTLDK